MFHFSIRDLLWVTVVAALGVGWWIDRRNLADERAQVRQLREEQCLMLEEIRLEMKQLVEIELRQWEQWGNRGFQSDALNTEAPAQILASD